MQRRIDPSSERAWYRQLADIIRDIIESGEWEPGRNLPSEADLCSEYEVSQATVRRAVAILRAEGLIESVRGMPWRVREKGEPTVVRKGAGTRVSFRMATRDDQEQHGIPEGAPVFVVTREDHPDEVYRADQTIVEFAAED